MTAILGAGYAMPAMYAATTAAQHANNEPAGGMGALILPALVFAVLILFAIIVGRDDRK